MCVTEADDDDEIDARKKIKSIFNEIFIDIERER